MGGGAGVSVLGAPAAAAAAADGDEGLMHLGDFWKTKSGQNTCVDFKSQILISHEPNGRTSCELGPIDDGLALGRLDGVNQALGLLIAVDEGRNRPNLAQAQPDGHVLWPVAQEDPHGVVLPVAHVQEHFGHPVAVLVDLIKSTETDRCCSVLDPLIFPILSRPPP